jgi:hypothetical protein
MWIGKMHAMMARERLGIYGPLDPKAITKQLGMRLVFLPLPDEIMGIYEDSCAYVSTSLAPQERGEMVEHELGHHLIHGPKASRQVWRDVDPVMIRKMDRQADDFAYFFHVPAFEIYRLMWRDIAIDEIAERYERDVRWMTRRIELACASGELGLFRTRAA